jgi:hypothetical protein
MVSTEGIRRTLRAIEAGEPVAFRFGRSTRLNHQKGSATECNQNSEGTSRAEVQRNEAKHDRFDALALARAKCSGRRRGPKPVDLLRAAALVFADDLTMEAIAAELGIARCTLWRWEQRPDFQAALEAERERWLAAHPQYRGRG